MGKNHTKVTDKSGTKSFRFRPESIPEVQHKSHLNADQINCRYTALFRIVYRTFDPSAASVVAQITAVLPGFGRIV